MSVINVSLSDLRDLTFGRVRWHSQGSRYCRYSKFKSDTCLIARFDPHPHCHFLTYSHSILILASD